MTMRAPVTLLATALLTGCAAMEPRPGFDEVAGEVRDRAGVRAHWNGGGPEDREAEGAVRGFLADELTAAEAVQVALLNNRGLQATYEELNIAQADLVEAGLLRNPVFDASVRWPTPGSGLGVELGVAQDFVSLLYIPLRKRRAEAAFGAAKLRVTGEVLDLVGRVRAAYYEVQAAEQRVEMRRTVLAAMDASRELAERLRAAGNIRELDLSNEQAAFEEAKVALAQAETQAILRREDLNELLGLWGEDTGWRAVPRLPDLPAHESEDTALLERRAVESSLDLGAARQEIEVAARALGIARPLGFLGEAEVGAVAEREVEGEWSVGPSLSLPVPLFDQGQGEIGRAQARLAQAAGRLHAMAVRLRARVRATAAARDWAYERAVYYQRVILPLRQRIVDQTQLQYNAMQVSPFELLQAKRQQVEAGGQYIDAVLEFWTLQSRLDQLLSGRMGASSADREEPTQTSTTSPAAGGGGH